MGGKHRQSKQISKVIGEMYSGETKYIEPFCGAMGSACKVIPILDEKGVTNFVLSDCSKPLINMWKAIIDGWTPPEFVSEKTYIKIKSTIDLNDPMTAYCGFAMSFGGKWFGGYIRGSKGGVDKLEWKRRHKNAKDSTLKKGKILFEYGVKIINKDYKKVKAFNSILYLDPPYKNRISPYNSLTFDHKKFWEWAKKMSKTNKVFVTEFTFPKGWEILHNWGDTVVTHKKGKKGNTSEVLLHYTGE